MAETWGNGPGSSLLLVSLSACVVLAAAYRQQLSQSECGLCTHHSTAPLSLASASSGADISRGAKSLSILLPPLTSQAASRRVRADLSQGQGERPLSPKSLIFPAGGAEISRCLQKIGQGVNHALGPARHPWCQSGVRSGARCRRGIG